MWFCKRFSGKKLYGHNGHNVSHLIFASCYVRDTYCSRHLNFAIFFLYGEIREINVSRKFHVTRRCVSVYLGVVVLRVWYFEHALMQLENCHHILPGKTNALLHLFAEPHSLYSMSQSTTKIVSFHDNVWKYAHLQCRHAWSQITT